MHLLLFCLEGFPLVKTRLNREKQFLLNDDFRAVAQGVHLVNVAILSLYLPFFKDFIHVISLYL
jgi:hypothetical protein